MFRFSPLEREGAGSLILKLKEKKTFFVLQKIELESKIPINITIIETKLRKGDYLSRFDFAIDFRSYFHCCKQSCDANVILIVEELANWFERKLLKIPASQEEMIDRKMKKAMKKINNIDFALSLRSNNYEKSNLSFSSISVAKLQKQIKKLKDIDKMKQVLQILQEHNVIVNPSDKVLIPLNSLSPECLQDLSLFLNE